jgi:putative inorganic carbon (HCO3(-)) transporter
MPALAAVAVFVGLGVQGLTDTIFFRPEVQLLGLFSLATLSAAGNEAAHRRSWTGGGANQPWRD